MCFVFFIIIIIIVITFFFFFFFFFLLFPVQTARPKCLPVHTPDVARRFVQQLSAVAKDAWAAAPEAKCFEQWYQRYHVANAFHEPQGFHQQATSLLFDVLRSGGCGVDPAASRVFNLWTSFSTCASQPQ